MRATEIIIICRFCVASCYMRVLCIPVGIYTGYDRRRRGDNVTIICNYLYLATCCTAPSDGLYVYCFVTLYTCNNVITPSYMRIVVRILDKTVYESTWKNSNRRVLRRTYMVAIENRFYFLVSRICCRIEHAVQQCSREVYKVRCDWLRE